MQAQRVAVVGPGSVGGFFAAHLSTTRHDVVSCARRPFDRYIVESPEAPIECEATVFTDPADLSGEPFDWVLVGLKAHQTEAAADWLDATCGPATTVVALQNGIESVERLTPLVKGATVLGLVVYCGSELLAPGHIRHSEHARLIVANDQDGHRLRELFEGTPTLIEPSDDYWKSAWWKLSLNALINGITALTGQPASAIGHPDLRPAATEMLREILEVGRADGVDLEVDGVEQTIEAISGLHEVRTSMLQDTVAGRPTEHDAIQGAVIRVARRHGLPTPYTDMVHGLLAARSSALEG